MTASGPHMPLAMGNEQRSEQDFASYTKETSKRVIGLGVLDMATAGVFAPYAGLGGWNNDSDFSGAGKPVAKVELLGGDLPSLKMTVGVNIITIRYNGTKWSALMNGSAPLNVTRYTYPGLGNAADYPVTARWDWEDTPNGRRIVLGIRCGLGWCLIGTTGSGNGPDANEDPGMGAPSYRRVRGWYDRKPLPSPSKDYAYIYPGPAVATSWHDSDFDQVGKHMASIRIGSNEVKINFKRHRKWDYFQHYIVARQGDAGEELDVHKVDFNDPDMPAATRWGRSHITLPTNPVANPITILSYDFGDAWVRCANGCCSTYIVFQ